MDTTDFLRHIDKTITETMKEIKDMQFLDAYRNLKSLSGQIRAYTRKVVATDNKINETSSNAV